MDRNLEMQRLDEVDVHLSKAERSIARQETLIQYMREAGLDAREAERHLRDFKNNRITMFEHRSAIAEIIDQIDAGLV